MLNHNVVRVVLGQQISIGAIMDEIIKLERKPCLYERILENQMTEEERPFFRKIFDEHLEEPSDEEVDYLTNMENVVKEFMHLLNVPILSSWRNDILKEKLQYLGWTEQQIANAERKAIYKSNWNKNYYVRQRIEGTGLKNRYSISGFTGTD